LAVLFYVNPQTVSRSRQGNPQRSLAPW
jgi:hypothetical protein